jgi:predicted dienelactone hydrolase
MENPMKTLLSVAALSFCAAQAHADVAGLQVTDLSLPHHGASVRVAIWYPAESSDAPTLYAGNPVFEGVEAHMDAPVSVGQYPVVLFSHGMGGTDRAQAWLGAALAERGVITVAVNHPNTTWGDFDMSKGVAHWTRAQDLSAALDALLDMPAFSGRLDMSRVMAAGFSYGGWTALSLGGARGNLSGIVDACTTYPEMEACEILMSEGVNMQGIDPEIWNASYADTRVTLVAAIDPGFVWGLEQSDIAGLLPSTLVIGFGGDADRLLATDFDKSGLADYLGDRRIERFDPAYHFSAMPLCTSAGEAILAEEKDDPVCTDPAGSDRATIHDRIVTLIADELDL